MCMRRLRAIARARAQIVAESVARARARARRRERDTVTGPPPLFLRAFVFITAPIYPLMATRESTADTESPVGDTMSPADR